MAPARLIRLIRLIGLLQSGRGHNTQELGELCEVHPRTIFRDLKMLRDAAVPVEYDEEKQRYHLTNTYYRPVTSLSPEEALAVLVLCHELGDADRLPFYAPARQAVVKLENSLPDTLRNKLRTLVSCIHINLQPTSAAVGNQSHYDQLLSAISDRLCLRIEYQSLAEDQILSTKLSPYQLLYSRHAWYAIGRSSLHRGIRTFNLGRIRRVDPLSENFEYPRGFTVDRYLRNAWHLIPESGQDSEVTVRFSKLVARNVAEVSWHKTQRCEFQADGSLDFHVTVSGLGEITWWVLGYGDQAEVIKPPQLRALVAERAARVVERYGRA